jgi:hypothetical protein
MDPTMQSPVVKRIPLPFPFNLLPSPLNGFNVTVPSGPHAYSTKTWVGKTTQGVTPEMAFQALRGRATPLQGGVSVSDGDMTDIPGFGRVRHIVDADRRTIVNTTSAGASAPSWQCLAVDRSRGGRSICCNAGVRNWRLAGTK